jgi:hypothetical protein
MEFKHHGLKIELPDDWWAEAGMANFAAKSNSYSVGQSASQIFEVSIKDVGPARRSPGVGIFNDGEEGTARTRAIRILRGFRLGEAIPPVELVEGKPEYGHRYKLTNGVHRLYCSLAVGFTHVPAVEGFDWESLDD